MPPEFSIEELADALKLTACFTAGALALFSVLCLVLAEETHLINLF